MNNKFFWIVGIIAVAGLIWFLASPSDTVPPGASPDTLTEADTTSVIEEELLTTDLADLEEEFSEIDALLNEL